MTTAALAIQGLTKRYGRGARERLALDSLDLDIAPGTIFAFLGPNGAGKSTTLKVVLGLVAPTAGTATILGGSIRDRAIRARIGYLPEEPVLHPFLTVADVLGFYGALFGLGGAQLAARIDSTLAIVGLSERRDSVLRDLSKGLRQRALLGQALINDPELILLDEPQSGLDPTGMQDLRALMLRLKAEGRTIFLNSHQLTEVEQVADRIGIIREGVLVREAATSDLLEQNEAWVVVIAGLSASAADDLVARFAAPEAASLPVVLLPASPGQHRFRCTSEPLAQAVMQAAQGSGGRLLEFQQEHANLEQVFFDLIDAPAAQGRP